MNAFEPETIGYTLVGFAQAPGVGVTRLREDIKAGHLIARRNGKKIVIVKEDGLKYLRSLPAVELSPAREA